jgi:hypothetical protein
MAAETPNSQVNACAEQDSLEAEVERLKAEASERWGERWVIETLQFADGDTQSHATRSYGRNEDGNIVEDRLFVNEAGETAVERVTIERRELDSETIEAPAPSA